MAITLTSSKPGASLATSRISDQLPIGINGNVEDGRWHNVLVSWSATDHILTYWFDGKQSGMLSQDVVAKLFGRFTICLPRIYSWNQRRLQCARGSPRFAHGPVRRPVAQRTDGHPAQTQLVIKTNKAGGKNNTLSRPIGSPGNDSFLFRTSTGFGAHATLGHSENRSNTGTTLTATKGFHGSTLALLSNYMAASFVTTADSHGGTLVTVAPLATQQLLLTRPHA